MLSTHGASGLTSVEPEEELYSENEREKEKEKEKENCTDNIFARGGQQVPASTSPVTGNI